MVCYVTIGDEKVTPTPNGKLNLDTMAEHVQNLFEFIKFYDQMGL